MAIIIFLGICCVAEGFVLYCLFHFAQEAIRAWHVNRTRSELFLKNQQILQPTMNGVISTAVRKAGEWRLNIADRYQGSAKPMISPQAKR
jgi:hypothetical protein